jgi:acetyltransferase-like isoleucine patch superfamily enzyme
MKEDMPLRRWIKNLGLKILTPFLNAYFSKMVYAEGSHFEQYLREFLMYQHLVFGDAQRVKIAPTACLNNALLNAASGTITIEDYVFFGHHVSILTGTHDYQKFDLERQTGIPQTHNDIIIRRGAWIASNATILGPCEIGEHAVIAASSLVIESVPAYTIVAGVPARVIRQIEH